MKRKTNISVQNNINIRRNADMIVGDKYLGYVSGDILDANAVQEKINSVGVDATIYDISVLHPTSGVSGGNTYASLSDALTVIPQDKQKGGMTVRYIQSSDNKYVQYRLKSTNFSTDTEDWEQSTTGLAVLITWSDLKALRDGGNLVPGQWYRITDYATTTTQTDTQSAGHAFDVIVRADDVNVLNENAYAALHSGDTYFANSKLNAWELKYTINNINWSLQKGEKIHTDDELWFDYIGTIVINGDTYKKWYNSNFDYAGNVCFVTTSNNIGDNASVYDLDNDKILEVDYSTIDNYSNNTDDGKGTITYMKDEFGNECPHDFKNIQFKRFYTTDAKGRDGIDSCYMVADPNNPAKDLSVDDTDNFIWAYTFSSDREGGTQTDTSLSGRITNNVIGSNNDSLPNNVFYGMSIYSNTFGDYCRNNTIGNYCYNNSIGESFYQNSIGNEFNNNSIGNNCNYNTIGNNCRNNTIGNDCYDNSIGNEFDNNSIGESFYQNSIGNEFNNNSIGESFYQNSIGNYFRYNTIGNSFDSNTIGNEFNNNSIGNGCNNIKIQKDYVYFIVIENGNQYINITSTKTTSSSQVLRNFTVAQGVNNSDSTKTISHNTTNDTFKTIYQNANSTTTDV